MVFITPFIEQYGAIMNHIKLELKWKYYFCLICSNIYAFSNKRSQIWNVKQPYIILDYIQLFWLF